MIADPVETTDGRDRPIGFLYIHCANLSRMMPTDNSARSQRTHIRLANSSESWTCFASFCDWSRTWTYLFIREIMKMGGFPKIIWNVIFLPLSKQERLISSWISSSEKQRFSLLLCFFLLLSFTFFLLYLFLHFQSRYPNQK